MMNLLKILIVDDDATVRIGLKTLIAWEQYGYRLVGEAANGQQAIEIVHREQPHIIITDMKMPVMDGLTLIKTLKNEEGFSVAFLVLSSYDDFELVKGAMKLGAVDYFLKLNWTSICCCPAWMKCEKRSHLRTPHVKMRLLEVFPHCSQR